MNTERYIIVTVKHWNIKHVKHMGDEYYLISRKKDLTVEKIKEINPRYIFVVHWHWLIPAEIYNRWEVVVFHMTDLPFGRGGSPYENLVKYGVVHSKVSAFRCNEILDGGPVYIKSEYFLSKDKKDTLCNISGIIFGYMIPYIINNNPIPIPQCGKVVSFKRDKRKKVVIR